MSPSGPWSTLAALALLPLALANFRIGCTALSHERLDSLVTPGKVSGHVHDFFGGSNMGMNDPSYDDLRKSKCTSCQVTQDKSVYWTPSLYFQWKNGSFSAVPNEEAQAYYYWSSPAQQKQMLPFPEGFRMISGTPSLRSDQKTASQQYGAVVFACLGSAHENTPYLPYGKCDNGIRADIYFPNCWDGKNVDSPTHTTHVAYSANLKDSGASGEGSYGASLPGSGACPKTHPKRLVSLGVSRYYYTSAFDYSKAKNPNQPFVFSNGDPTGYGFHGDLINGWDIPVLKAAIAQCTFKDGSPEFCPPFKLQSTTQPGQPFAPLCRRTPIVNEPVKGPLKKLPGCNPVTKGPGNAPPATNCPAVPTFPKPAVYSGPVPPVNAKVPSDMASVLPAFRSYKHNGCFSSSTKSPALGTKLAVSGKMTPQKCLTACDKKKFAFCGVQGSSCFGAKAINKSAKKRTIGSCWTPCAGSLNFCGGPAALSIYKRS